MMLYFVKKSFLLDSNCFTPLVRAHFVWGGTALLSKDNFTVRQLAAGEKSSFEFYEYLIGAFSFQFRLVVLCMPPYCAGHPVSSSTFFMEFSGYMESLVSPKVPLCISSDFNFHLDISDDVDTVEFIDLLDSMCLIIC